MNPLVYAKSNHVETYAWKLENIKKYDLLDANSVLYALSEFYKYPHEYPNHYVPQQYLPDKLKNAVYYQYGANKAEQAAKAYWDKIKGEK